MADTKISALAAVAAVVAAQELAVNDAGVSKKATATQVAAFLFARIAGASGAAGEYITVQKLTANSADVTTTALSSAVMTMTGLGAGIYVVEGFLIYQTAATTTGIGFGINHTGTATLPVAHWLHTTTGGTAATGIGDGDATTVAGQMAEGKSDRNSLNAIIGSASAGVDTINANILAYLNAILNVTVSGDLQLKIASEVASSAVRLIAGSVLRIMKVG